MSYVDGFLLPVPKKNMSVYRGMAKMASKVWREHGALEYFECTLDEAKPSFGLSFTKGVKMKAGDVVVYSFIVYRSKAHRNAVNKKVMKDPRLAAMMEGKKMPFDMKRMMYGGFKVIVEA